MITLHIIDIHFEPNNTFPPIWILHVALFDPIGSPLDYPLAQNDWRALAAALRLEGSTTFFSLRKSPTECVVTMWEVQR